MKRIFSKPRQLKVSAIDFEKLLPFRTVSTQPSLHNFPFEIELEFFVELAKIFFTSSIELSRNFFFLSL